MAALFGVTVAVALLALGGAALWKPALLRGSSTAAVPVWRTPLGTAAATEAFRPIVYVAGAAALVLMPPMMSESSVFKLGLVLIFAIAAMGLHVLVNWTGELSLGHAGIVGLPAFVLAQISFHGRISPIVLIPVAIAVGALSGAVIALPAFRARGLYVAIVTLASGIAIDRFFFTRPWIVGDGSVRVSDATLGPIAFDDSRSLYPVLAILFTFTVLAMRALHRSKVARSFLWIRTNRDAAAAFGVPVDRYRIGAYAIAGALAGLAGGLTSIWLSLVVAQTFPLTLGFDYLVAVVLAGAGSVGGVLVAAALLQGLPYLVSDLGPAVAYGGPIGLLFMLTRHPAGLNGVGRQMMRKLRVLSGGEQAASGDGSGTEEQGRPRGQGKLSVSLVIGALLIGEGAVAIGLGWYYSGNTDQVWIQIQHLISGALGGLALIIVGVCFVLRDAIARAEVRMADRIGAAVAEALETRDAPVRRPATGTGSSRD
ncbi:MAG: branched-chain amino acid ABC transporter permease [Actinomycetota bacterium]